MKYYISAIYSTLEYSLAGMDREVGFLQTSCPSPDMPATCEYRICPVGVDLYGISVHLWGMDMYLPS